MTATHNTKVLIIGSGPAGYTAAIYAARANLEPIMASGRAPGGQLMITTDVENYPGFREVIQGPWLMEEMRGQAEAVGTKIIACDITKIDTSTRPFRCESDSGDTFVADTIIISTGAQAKWLGLPSEEKFQGFGVSGCATCDGFFFREKEVAVIGGGDSAVEEALYLTHHASKVTIIHRRDEFRAEKVMQDRLFKNPKIEVLFDHVVEEFLGEDKPKSLTGLRLKNTKTGAEQTLNVDGAFVAIGHKPSTKYFTEILDLDEAGYIKCPPGTTVTSVPGIFAAGDVQDKIYRQAVTAAGQGCMAALDVERYLAELEDQGESHDSLRATS
ncbi:MAG: thioredoxin-disulfide reductase [Alphaproteobacteria bacterium]